MPRHNKHHKKNKKGKHSQSGHTKQKQKKHGKGNHPKSKNNHHHKANVEDQSRIIQVKDVRDLKLESEHEHHGEDSSLTDFVMTSPSFTSTSSPSMSYEHSPIVKVNYYDADSSDSDTSHIQHIACIEPMPSIPCKLKSTQSLPIPNLSPAFDKDSDSMFRLHQTLPTLHRAFSSPTIPSSILKKSSSSSTRSTDQSQSVSFGAVEIHEFPLSAGSESDGVPEDGGLSLHLHGEEVNAETLNLDDYEQRRYDRWKQRAQTKAKQLHWNRKRLAKVLDNPERYLFTAGRCDEFYASLTPKEREQRLEIDANWKAAHCTELEQEQRELNELRHSRKQNEIFCDCKPLNSMSTTELKRVAKEYGIDLKQKRGKIRRGFLLNQIKSKVPNYRDICCWDKVSCSCSAAGIDCHSGNDQKHEQCGCVASRTQCGNANGRYMYRQPAYSKSVIDEWHTHYQQQQKVSAS